VASGIGSLGNGIAAGAAVVTAALATSGSAHVRPEEVSNAPAKPNASIARFIMNSPKTASIVDQQKAIFMPQFDH
jgi:hypothetical protein